MNFALDFIGKTTILLVCAGLAAAAFRRASASTRHAIWVVSLAASVLLPVAMRMIPQLEWPVLPSGHTTVTFTPFETAVAAATPPELVARGTQPVRPSWLLTLWALGALLLLARFIAGTIVVRRIAKTALPVTSPNLRSIVVELSNAMRLRRPVRLVCGELSPMTWGVLQHTVLVPSAAETWSEERQRVVLAHELAHVTRRDGLIQMLTQIVCSLYWFNPLVWYAAYRLRIERERACDDYVLGLGTPAEDYADHLVQIVRGLRGKKSFSVAAVSMAKPTQLETRLVSILDSRVSRFALSKAELFLLCLFTGLATASLAAVDITAAVPLPATIGGAVSPVASAIPPSRPEPKPAPAAQRTRIGNPGAAASAVTPPQIVKSSTPFYTPQAISAKVEGAVTLEVAVDVEGKVKVLRVIKGLGYGLDETATKAVLGWTFSPAARDGQAVEAVMQVDVDFKIPPGNFTLSIVEEGQADAVPVVPRQPTAPDDMPPVKMARGVSPPSVTFRVEPQYTQEARDAKYRGTAVVTAIIHQDGTLTVDKVVQGLDYGLTEKAIEALELWKFRPGSMDGRPVPVSLNIEVNFNLK